jgi:hypothetical protein
MEGVPVNMYDAAGARPGDLFICIEHCFDCPSHKTSLRHDQNRYLSCANSLLEMLTQEVLNVKTRYPFLRRAFAFRLKPSSYKRFGALEVTVAVKMAPDIKSKTRRHRPAKYLWRICKLHSKLGKLRYGLSNFFVTFFMESSFFYLIFCPPYSWPIAQNCKIGLLAFLEDWSVVCDWDASEAPLSDRGADFNDIFSLHGHNIIFNFIIRYDSVKINNFFCVN